MRKKLMSILIFLGVAFMVAPFSFAQEKEVAEVNYLDCGHCDPNWTPEMEGCSQETGCAVDINSQLKYLPYYGIPEVAKTTPPLYALAVGFLIGFLIALVLI